MEALKNGEAADRAQSKAQPSSAAVEYREKKAYQSELNKAKTAVSRAEAGVAAAEAELEELNAQLALPYIASDYVKAGELSKKADDVRQRIEALYEEWENAEQRLAALNEPGSR